MSVSGVAAVVMAGWLVVASGGSGAVGPCPSADVSAVGNDPVVRAALDGAWRDSNEGSPDEHEEGGFVFQCQGGPTGYETRVQRWPRGTTDHGAVTRGPEPPAGCRAVATFHTHPGGLPGSHDDGFDNEHPSDDDLNFSNRYGIPGIIRWGEGADPAGTHDVPYGPASPANPTWQCPQPPVGSSSGDPHLRTFDGVQYDFQVPGDFVLVESADGLTVQARFELVVTPRISGSHPMAQARSVAIRFGGMTLEIGVDGIYVDDRSVTFGDLPSLRPPDGGTIAIDELGAARFTWPDGTLFVVAGPISLTMRLAQGRSGNVHGLLGDADGDPTNDLRLADGTAVAKDGLLSYEQLSGPWAEANRVPAARSLFHDPKPPPVTATSGIPGQASQLADDVRAAATRACAAAGVTDPQLLTDCTLDVGGSGNPAFAAAALATQHALADLLHPSSPADVELLRAASNGDTAGVQRIITNGEANPDARRTVDGATSLMIAAQQGNESMIAALLAAHADVNTRDNGGRTALGFGAAQGNANVLAELLAAGAVPNARTSTGWTPLHAAAFNGTDSAIGPLITAGSIVDSVDDRGLTPLVAAAQVGHTSTAKLLLDHGANIEAPTVSGWTALSWAASNAHLDTVQLLVDRGADPNHRAGDGSTALHAAAALGNAAVVTALLAAGADRMIVDDSGARPVDIAIRFGNHDVIAMLR